MMSNATGVSVWAVWGRPVLAAAGLSSPKYAPPPPSWIRGTVGSSAGGGRGREAARAFDTLHCKQGVGAEETRGVWVLSGSVF